MEGKRGVRERGREGGGRVRGRGGKKGWMHGEEGGRETEGGGGGGGGGGGDGERVCGREENGRRDSGRDEVRDEEKKKR